VITLYHAERTRSVRVVWLLEELGLPYELRKVQFAPPVRGFFSQATPLGKLPVIEDDGMLMAESGAILEYIVERHGGGRLAPAPGSRLRGPYLQWMHFAEGTAYPPIGTLIWHLLYKRDAESVPEVVEDARGRARSGLAFVERALEGRAAFQRASTR
jgi:glutathione S-transferase